MNMNEMKIENKAKRTRKRRMKPKDIIVLRMIKERASIQEIVTAVGVHSTNSVHRRLKLLEAAGLVNPPPRARMARSRSLTEMGEKALAQYDTPGTEAVIPAGDGNPQG